MQEYTKNFLRYYPMYDSKIDRVFIPCAVCLYEGDRPIEDAVDLHHMKKRSETKDDEVHNLLPCCRRCHDKLEARQYTLGQQHHIRFAWHISYHPTFQFPMDDNYFSL